MDIKRKSQSRHRNRCRCGCGASIKLGRDYVRGHHKRKADRYATTDAGYETPCWIWKLGKTNDGYGLVRSGPET